MDFRLKRGHPVGRRVLLERQTYFFYLLGHPYERKEESRVGGSTLRVGAAIVVKARRPDVGRSRSDQPAVVQLLQTVRRPADDATHGARASEQRGGESQTRSEERRVGKESRAE